MNKTDLCWAIKKQIQKHIWGLSKSPLTFWYDRTPCASPLHALVRVKFLRHSICLTLALAPSCAALRFWCLYIMLSNPICHEDVIESPGLLINPHMICIMLGSINGSIQTSIKTIMELKWEQNPNKQLLSIYKHWSNSNKWLERKYVSWLDCVGLPIFKFLKISLKLDCQLLDWWLSGSGVLEVVVFFVSNWEGCLFPGSLLFIANCVFCLCHCHFVRRFISKNAKPRTKIYVSETKTALLHGDLWTHPKIVSHHRPPTFIINIWHSCSPMSQAPRIHDFHQAHLARDHPGYRLVNSSQWFSFSRDPIIFWER